MSDPIIRGEGLTQSERRLVTHASRTFLRLWSYPNIFNDRTIRSSGVGQEIADLLAVFEDHVVLFSDKEIRWQADKPLNLAWARWYRKAVEGAVVQLKGAERWLDLHPDRIFTDQRCTQTLPVPLPPRTRRITHLVAVAGGVEAASRRFFGDPRGTLMIQPTVKGADHVDPARRGFIPFTIGDVNSDGTFVHVFDPTGLEVVMSELDTVADFTAYLMARAKFLRSGALAVATGEEHLLAAYMMNGFIDGRPSFLPEKLRKKARRKALLIPEHEYETYISSQVYAELSQLKSQSLLWDEMIELVSEDVLKGTSISILQEQPTVEKSEAALRVMASERRMDRVSLSQALWGAMNRCLDEEMARLVRRVLITRLKPSKKIGYVFLILPWDADAGSYEQYRVYRSEMLATYGFSLFREQPKLDLVVALAVDIFRRDGKIRTRSEDVLAMEPPVWTPELVETFETNRELFEFKELHELEGLKTRRRVRNPFKVRGHPIGS